MARPENVPSELAVFSHLIEIIQFRQKSGQIGGPIHAP